LCLGTRHTYDEPAVLVEINELHFRFVTLTTQIHDETRIK